MSECFTCQIQGNEFIGDSLDKININFINMLTVACSLSAELNGVTSYGVVSVSGINTINSQSGGTGYNVTSITCPQWHIGQTNTQLFLEPAASRISKQASKQADFQAYISSIKNNNPIYTNSVSTHINTAMVPAPGADVYRKGNMLQDGRILFIPFSSTAPACIYNTKDNTINIQAGFVSVNQGFFGGVLLPDGRVFCVPHNSTTATIYTPGYPTGTFTNTNTGGVYPGSKAYIGGTLLPDGRVLMSPYNTNSISIFNPVTFTKTAYPFGGAYTSMSLYGCVLASNNIVYFVSNSTPHLWAFNTSTNSVLSYLNVLPSVADAYRGAVRMSDNRILFVPYNSTKAAIIDISSGTPVVSLTPSIFPGAGAYETGTLLPDGRVLLCPSNATSPGIFNPYDTTLQSVNVTTTVNDYHGSMLLTNGKTLLLPRNASTGLLINIPYERNFTLTALTGPYFNKL